LCMYCILISHKIMSLPMEHRHDNIVYIVCILSGALSSGSQRSMLN